MNLLKITTTPIKIAVNVERARFEKVDIPFQSKQPRPQRITPTQQQPIRQQPKQQQRIEVPFQQNQDVVRQNPLLAAGANVTNALNSAQQTINHTLSLTIPGETLSSMVQNKVYEAQSNHIAYVPSTSDLKFEPGALALEFNPIQVDIDMSMISDEMRYIPSRMTFEIEQYPTVEIEYIGDPLYVPPSANPNYDKK